MVSVKVRNFRGCARADIAVSPFALIAGLNAGGKSSICQAVAAALTGIPVPYGGLTKSQAGALVRSGEAEGQVEVSTDRGKAVIQWPSAKILSEGLPPEASRVAVGLDSLVDLAKDKERAELLGRYIQVTPSAEDIATAVKDVCDDDDIVKAVTKTINELGWDSAHTRAKDSGAKLKGAWEFITNTDYGKDKAKKWQPSAWSEELAGTSKDSLDAAVTEAKATLEATIAGAAVAEADLAALREKAATKSDAQASALAADAAVAIAEAEVTAAEEARRALPSPEDGPAHSLTCPHCEKKVRLTEAAKNVKVLVKIDEPVDSKEAKKRQAAIAEADGLIQTKTIARNEVRAKWHAAALALQETNKAAQRLEEIEAAPKGAGNVEQAREALRIAEQRQQAFVAKTSADQKAAAIEINQAIVALLAPDGLRKSALVRGLETFYREHLSPLTQAAGWKPVTVEADLMPRYGSRPYALLSESEQYRVRTVLQLAMAKIDKSAMVVLDRADMLDQQGRNGLIGLLREAGLPALISMMMNEPRFCPDLSKASLGASYWISEGVASEIGAAMESRAAE